MKRRFGLLILLLALGALLLIQPKSTLAIEPPASLNAGLIISELKPHNDSSGLNEFIEIHNYSSQAVSLKDFSLAYFNVYSPHSSQPTSTQAFGDIVLSPYQYLILARTTAQISGSISLVSISSLKDDEGTVRLLGPDPVLPGASKIYDQVSWFKPSVGKPLPADTNELPAASKSLQRVSRQTAVPAVFEPAWQAGSPTPFSYSYIAPEPPVEEIPPGSELTCEGILINELLPNPAGNDAGYELIELYNPTNEVIPLAGCALQTSASTKKYAFGNISLQPNEYLAINDSTSGLILSNASGSSVWLLSATDEELQAITYPGGLDDNQAWGLFAVGWQATYQPTPGQDNILVALKPCPAGQERNIETGQCRSVAAVLPPRELVPCRSDQERNPETNRCRLIQMVSAGLIACGPAQERNPATNRCRSLSSSSGLVPCKEGQERNPETNRCRSVVSTASNLVPCDEGQERNPETNRCRKVLSGTNVAGLTDVKDISTGSVANSPRWILASIAILAALGYAFYEWRQEAVGFIAKLKARFAH